MPPSMLRALRTARASAKVGNFLRSLYQRGGEKATPDFLKGRKFKTQGERHDLKTDYTYSQAERRLQEYGFSAQEISNAEKNGCTALQVCADVERLIDSGIVYAENVREEYVAANPQLFNDENDSTDCTDHRTIRGRSGAEFTGRFEVEYLWKPFLPLGEYTVIFGQSGTGKTFYTSLLCAYVTRGKAFPLDMDDFIDREAENVLYITGEESFEEVCDRLIKCGGDPNHLIVIDRNESVGLNLKEGFSELAYIVEAYKPKLIVLDPWQSFIGETVDMNRQNQLRPMLQKIALLAGQNKCSVILISHVNKREQGQDASNAASGSGELINASRSAIKLIEDEDDDNRRIAIHTKSNHSKRGKSLCFCFTDDGKVVFDGTSDITKSDLEKAARARKTPKEIKRSQREYVDNREKLIAALLNEAANTEQCGKRLTYEEIRSTHGNDIFGEGQPKKMLESIADELRERGVYIKTGIDIRRGSKHYNGFFVQKTTDTESK